MNNRNKLEKAPRTAEALRILGAQQPYGDNVQRTFDRDMDKDYVPKHWDKEYQ